MNGASVNIVNIIMDGSSLGIVYVDTSKNLNILKTYIPATSAAGIPLVLGTSAGIIS
jgi:hypothetical protein